MKQWYYISRYILLGNVTIISWFNYYLLFNSRCTYNLYLNVYTLFYVYFNISDNINYL